VATKKEDFLFLNEIIRQARGIYFKNRGGTGR
jgi:hypothetical protein